MLFLLCYAVITFIAWILALNIRPDRYPNASTEAVFEWKYRRIRSCKIYSALTLIFLIALIAVNFIASYVITPENLHGTQSIPLYLSIFVFAIYIYMAYMVFILCYRAYKNYQLGKDLGIL
ncbi:hypothetical protein L3V83_08565 [Thiotrichales bacterium 19X7-9]|nr:hypothetical protein [Thiotrichales bacterium 19X7-9]